MSTDASLGYLPLTLGTSRVGLYQSAGGEAPARLRVHGQCWELVTDPLLDVALVTPEGDPVAQEAFAARLARILRLEVGHLVAGDATIDQAVVQSISAAVARVISLDADRITSGTIDTARLSASEVAAAVARVISLDAGRITSGTISTARLDAQAVAAAVGRFLTLQAGQITTGTIDTARLDAASIAAAVATIIELDADRITTGTLDAGRIAARSITAAHLLVDGTLATQIVDAMTVATKQLVVTEDAILNRATVINDLAAKVVSAARIYASQLVVAALDEDGNLNPDSVNAVNIADGAVTAEKITVTQALAAQIVQAMSVAAKRLVVTEDAVIQHAKLLGDTIVENINVTGKLIGADGVFTGTVDAENVNVTDELLAQKILAAGGVTVAQDGTEVGITSDGVEMTRTGPDGPERVFYLGPDGESIAQFGSTTLTEKNISSPSGSFNSLFVGGQNISDMVSALPQGEVYRYEVTDDSAWHGSETENYRIQISAFLQPGRAYRVEVPAHFVQRRAATGGTGYLLERIRYDFPDRTGAVKPTSPAIAQARHPIPATTLPVTVPTVTGYLRTDDWPAARWTWIILTVASVGGMDYRHNAGETFPLTMSVHDMGPSGAISGRNWTHLGIPAQGTSEAPAESAPEKVTRTTTWTAGGYGGDLSAGQIVQGTYPGVGERWGGWTFSTAMRDALSKADSIQRFRVYLHAEHWYYFSGGTAIIRPNNGTYKGTEFGTVRVESANWPRQSGRWITVPASWHQHFISGLYKGISVKAMNTGLTQYGRFLPGNTRFEVTYTS